jgi:ADP-ribose pyrophosphatase YjhB (NUDIX family)
MRSEQLLLCAQRLQAIAQAGLTYAANAYDFERYQEVRSISAKLLQELTDEPYEKILGVFASDTGYPTPKVDVRGVVFRGQDEILMVREKIDGGRWTLPGGWADVGCTPFEAAIKEVKEETGLNVRARRLLGLFDKRKHEHPPHPWYVYKAFILCDWESGALLDETSETTGASWFRRDELSGIELSTERTTAAQLETMFQFANNPSLPALCD